MTESVAPQLLDVKSLRKDFPILATQVGGRPLVYLDNAATSQKPQLVLDVLDRYWREQNANVHRGVHHLSMIATREFDAAREKIRCLLNARSASEVILTKGCTEGINLVANCLSVDYGPYRARIRSGSTILVSTMEHHSNIVPWQIAAQRVGAQVLPIPISDEGEIDLDAYRALLKSHSVALVGVVHVSNSLGTINPVKEMAALAHEAGALILVDGAQAGPHWRIDVQDLDADFYTLSCHKIYAPTGVGVLYGKESLLREMPPYHGGGDMIRTVSFDGTTYAEPPAKFEAGTPNMAGVIGLGAAIDYVAGLGGEGDYRSRIERGLDGIHQQEVRLLERATSAIEAIGGVTITGRSPQKAGILSFIVDGAHPHDIGTILDQQGIAIRAGHHCCMPLMKRLGLAATARASFAFYNTEEEVDALVQGVIAVKEMFA